MDAFLRKHHAFLLSTLYLITGLILLGYSTLYSGREVAMADALLLNLRIADDNKALAEQAAKQKAVQAVPQEGIRSLPVFLGHINSVAQKTTVIIKELTPSRDADLKFLLKITSDYTTFLRFAAELESLNLVINDLQVRPYDASKTPPVHAIEFSITPRNDAAPMSDARVVALHNQIAAQDKRNPFQRFAFNAVTKEVSAEIDLTWIHKLSGVGRVGERKVATINVKNETRDYSVGDELEPGLLISGIENDRVQLQKKTSEGTARYVLRFRRSAVAKQP